tara:strand:+ start:4762 stop:4992 length:231 start_codon:yes stop_codon:yes gene_type:complete
LVVALALPAESRSDTIFECVDAGVFCRELVTILAGFFACVIMGAVRYRVEHIRTARVPSQIRYVEVKRIAVIVTTF